MRFFDDFASGATETYGPIRVTKNDIVSFARAYDPQPFHMGEEAAKATFVGTLIASGWHTCVVNMRLIADGFLLDSASMGAPGIEEVKWLRPVRPGDGLRSRVSVLDARPSRSRPELGLVQFRFDVLNQADEVVLSQRNWIMFARRGASPATPFAATRSITSTSLSAGPTPLRAGAGAPFEDPMPRQTTDLGAHTFTADDIVDFARTFDPQPFHVDPVAAKTSPFGGLCASGWHTAAVWMRLMIGHRNRAGGGAPKLGPSPGFKNLTWAKPVYAGDTIRYSSTITGTRPSASRPGWDLAFHRNSGVNQAGEEVFAFEGAVFRERP
jgi:acyl dehydratase